MKLFGQGLGNMVAMYRKGQNENPGDEVTELDASQSQVEKVKEDFDSKKETALATVKEALDKVTKKELTDLRNLKNPHNDVQSVIAAVMTVVKKDKKWDSAVKLMTQPDQFLKLLSDVKPFQLSKAIENKLLE